MPWPTQHLGHIHLSDIKTQKARGFKLLHEGFAVGYTDGLGITTGYSYILPQNQETLERSYGVIGHGPWFARPCPTVPRHGFVESRQVMDFNAAKQVLAEARTVDPDAELLLIKKLEGKFSAVATNTGVTWGMGNDGVTTGGQGEVKFIPTPMTTAKAWLSIGQVAKRLAEDGTPVKGTAYVELVEHNDLVIPVQYRDGPEQPVTADFIPKRIKVKKVLDGKGSLLEWEKTVLENKRVPGVVVSLPKGALSSHWAVHAIAVGMPVVTTRPVAVGDVLEPPAKVQASLTATDYKQIAKDIKTWVKFYPNKRNDALLVTSIATMHSMNSWDNTPHLLTLRGAAVASLVKFLTAASLGELRHFEYKGPGRKGKKPLTKLNFPLDDVGRDRVYQAVFRLKSFAAHIKHLTTAEKDFNSGWSNRIGYRNADGTHIRSYGFGGPKWAEVARIGKTFATAVQRFVRKPNKSRWIKVTIAMNNAIHTAHNGGFALNKWISDDVFRYVEKAPATGFMNTIAGQIVLGLYGPTVGEKK